MTTLSRYGAAAPAGADRAVPARVVLDYHAGLRRALRSPSLALIHDIQDGLDNDNLSFHPASHGPAEMLAALAGDLFDARTYQVTSEMVDLAEALLGQDVDGGKDVTFEPEMLPHPWGFAWLDRPWIVAAYTGSVRSRAPHARREPIAVRALSWGPQGGGTTPAGAAVHAVRFALWGFADDMVGREARDGDHFVTVTTAEAAKMTAVAGTPFQAVFAIMAPFGDRLRADLAVPDMRVPAVLWALMTMGITRADPVPVDRATARRAGRELRHADVRVVKLRRAEGDHHQGIAKNVDWSCRWLVRGHKRHYQNGKTVWIKPYIKGPDGKPLRVSDVVYRLER